MSVQGMPYQEPTVYNALAQMFFASGLKQVILQPVLYVGRKSCSKLAGTEVVEFACLLN